MTQPSTQEVICSVCSKAGTGRFCSNCGAPLQPSTCEGCNAALTPGARFCHNCGRPAPTASPVENVQKSSSSSSLPWIVAAISLVTLLAFLAGSAFNSRRGSGLDAPQNALPQAGLDGPAMPPGVSSDEGVVRGPDISQLSPQERADRLFKRVMLLSSQGKTDSVLFFAPMAISAYQLLSPMNSDQRYDLGRIAEVAGAFPLAKAQVDTILRENPRHLLGLVLAARIAALTGDSAAKKTYEAKLVAAYPSESARKLPEYERHADDLSSALADVRRAPAR